MKRVLGANSEALTPEQYTSPDHHVWDLHFKNLLQDKNGNVFVIDALLELNTPDRHLGGDREYEQFNVVKNQSSYPNETDSILKSVASRQDAPVFYVV